MQNNIDYIKDNKVPGILEEDYYMINIEELEHWYYNVFYNNWKNKDNTIF